MEPSRKKKRLMHISSVKVFSKTREEDIELSAPFIPEERRVDEWVPPPSSYNSCLKRRSSPLNCSITELIVDEPVEMEIEPTTNSDQMEDSDFDYSIMTSADTETDIEQKLEDLEREVEEQRAIRRHIEQQVESLSRILKNSMQVSRKKKKK